MSIHANPAGSLGRQQVTHRICSLTTHRCFCWWRDDDCMGSRKGIKVGKWLQLIGNAAGITKAGRSLGTPLLWPQVVSVSMETGSSGIRRKAASQGERLVPC